MDARQALAFVGDVGFAVDKFDVVHLREQPDDALKGSAKRVGRRVDSALQ